MITMSGERFARAWGRTKKAAECREAFNRYGQRDGDGWRFASVPDFQHAIIEAGRALGLKTASELPAPANALILADERRPTCKACDRYRGDAGRLGVHCGCRGSRPCSNVVKLAEACPDGKW